MKGTNIKNGKGVEYKIKKDNLLVFKGEYLNGKRNGKGREYYDNNNLKYQGEYKEGKIWNGKGYDINGKLEFELKNGNVKVKEYHNNNSPLLLYSFPFPFLSPFKYSPSNNNFSSLLYAFTFPFPFFTSNSNFPFMSYPFPFHIFPSLYSP